MISRTLLIRLSCLAACLAASLLAFDAEAGWHHRQGCGSCGSHHHRHGWHRGSHGSSGGSHGGSSGGATGGSAGGAAAAAPAAKAPAPAPKTASLVPADGSMLLVEVPEHAKVFINGTPTTVTGGLRKFAAKGLADDKQYAYEVKMIVEDGAQAKELTKTVWLVAGEEQTVSFHAADATAVADVGKTAPSPVAETNLTLRVPADARVWIEGQLTASTGPVRTFGTKRLAEGQEWQDYEVRVVAIVNGEEQAVVKRLTLTGGKDVDVTIDPASQSPAVEATASVR